MTINGGGGGVSLSLELELIYNTVPGEEDITDACTIDNRAVSMLVLGWFYIVTVRLQSVADVSRNESQQLIHHEDYGKYTYTPQSFSNSDV